MQETPRLQLLYDGECPVCNYYVRHVRIRQSVGNIELISAREASTLKDEVTALGMNIDKGMVLKAGDQFYFGQDAIYVLATMGTRIGWFNQLNYRIFSNKFLASLLYPFCRLLRFILLKLKSIKPIGNLNEK